MLLVLHGVGVSCDNNRLSFFIEGVRECLDSRNLQNFLISNRREVIQSQFCDFDRLEPATLSGQICWFGNEWTSTTGM